MTEIETFSLQTQQNKVKALFGLGRTSWRSRASHMYSSSSSSPIPIIFAFHVPVVNIKACWNLRAPVWVVKWFLHLLTMTGILRKTSLMG